MAPLPELVGEVDGLTRRRVGSAHLSAAETRTYTWQEVAKHNTLDSVWVSYKGKVYDVTGFVGSHPGGSEVLHLMAGRDVTHAFDAHHPFTFKPEKVIAKYYIGELATHEFPPYAPDSGMYREIRERVAAYFKERNIDSRDPWPGIWRSVGMMVTAVVVFTALHAPWGPQSMLLRAGLAVALGCLQALPLVHVMHDSSHMAFGHSERWWTVGRFFMDVYAGCNMTSWHNQHIVGHHVYTNVYGVDPDLPKAETGDVRRLVTRQRWAWVYRYQWLYLPVLYGFLGVMMRVQDFTETFGARVNGPQRVNPISAAAWAEMLLTKVVWASFRLYLPLAVWHTAYFWPLFCLTEYVTGLYLAFNFQVSHVSTECEFRGEDGQLLCEAPARAPLKPRGGRKAPSQNEWAVSQVRACVDFAHDSWFVTFQGGALNYQIVHHLLPGCSQYHYPAITPIVIDVCRDYGVEYKVLSGFWEAWCAHVRLLYVLGQRGEPAEFPGMG